MVESSDPILSQAAEMVTSVEIATPEIQNLIDGMYEVAAGKGHDQADRRRVLGLAATQVSASKRIILVDIAADGSHKDQDLQAFINPVIRRRSELTVPGREGCWSTGNVCGNVPRAAEIEFEAINRRGELVKHIFTGFTARIVQHETDHLDGVRFPERIANDADLHWVEHAEFPAYRTNWQHWLKRCSRITWEAMKAGQLVGGRPIDIYKAGGIIMRDRKLLLERSKGKTIFINPGGKVEPGETVKQALVRELMEEFQIVVKESDLENFGRFYAAAAGQEHRTVCMDLFMVKHWEGEPTPDNEVEEIRWVTSALEPGLKTGSIFEHEVIPRLKARGLID